MTVAANHGHSGQGEALLWADHMDDSLAGVTHRIKLHTELLAVAAKRLHLFATDRVGDRLVDIGGGNVVVLCGYGQFRVAYLPAGNPKTVECLWRGDLVYEVQIYEKQVGVAVGGSDQVAVPDFLTESLGFGRSLHRLSWCPERGGASSGFVQNTGSVGRRAVSRSGVPIPCRLEESQGSFGINVARMDDYRPLFTHCCRSRVSNYPKNCVDSAVVSDVAEPGNAPLHRHLVGVVKFTGVNG